MSDTDWGRGELRAWQDRLQLTAAEAAALLRTPLATYRGWVGVRQEGQALPGIVQVACRGLERETLERQARAARERLDALDSGKPELDWPGREA